MKHLTPILFAFLFLFACNKEEGFLPSQDKKVAYYSDHSPTLEWSTEASIGNDTLPFIAGTPQIVADMVFVTIQARRELKAFSYDSGELLWTTDLEPFLKNNSTPDYYTVIERSGNLYFIDKEEGLILHIDKESGQVLSAYDPDENGLNLRRQFPAIIEGDQFYKMHYIGPGASSLVKVDFRDGTYTTIATLDGFQRLDDFSDAVIEPEDNRIYFTAIRDASKGAYSIDLESGEINLLWRGDEIYSNKTPLAIIGQRLIFINALGPIIAIDKESGEMIWTYENNQLSIDAIIVKDDQLYCTDHHGRMLSLDPASGSLNWLVSDLPLPRNETYGLYEQENIMVAGTSELHIVDLSDGQILVSAKLPEPDSQYIRSLTFDPVQKKVVVASYYHLLKYSDLLP